MLMNTVTASDLDRADSLLRALLDTDDPARQNQLLQQLRRRSPALYEDVVRRAQAMQARADAGLSGLAGLGFFNFIADAIGGAVKGVIGGGAPAAPAPVYAAAPPPPRPRPRPKPRPAAASSSMLMPLLFGGGLLAMLLLKK